MGKSVSFLFSFSLHRTEISSYPRTLHQDCNIYIQLKRNTQNNKLRGAWILPQTNRQTRPQSRHSFLPSNRTKRIGPQSAQFSSVQSLSHVRLFVTPWTAACQASLSITSCWIYPNPYPLSHWCHPTISSSVVPFSSCPQYWELVERKWGLKEAWLEAGNKEENKGKQTFTSSSTHDD